MVDSVFSDGKTTHKKRSFGKWHSKMSFPSIVNTIFIDIETDIEMQKVWLIGVKLGDIEEQYLAGNWAEEKAILDDLTKFLQANEDKALVCYSSTNFDFRILENVAKRHNSLDLIEQLQNRALIDMATLLRRHFTPLGGKYSLKLLRFLIGYKYDDISIAGSDVAILYDRQVRKFGRITKEFAHKALKYNLDDIRILPFMIYKFEDNIKFTDNFTNFINLQELKSVLSDAIYSKNISTDFVRISFYNEFVEDITHQLMSQGLPLPEVIQGVHTTALYWRSNFARRCARKFVSGIDLLDFE